MVKRQWQLAWIALAVTLNLAGSLAEAQVATLDPKQGEVDGKAALAMWASPEGSREGPLNATGMTAHLVPVADPDLELVFPCGAWISPPAGEYRFWLEGNGYISPAHGVMGYSAPPFRGRGSITVRTVVPAGWVEPGSAVSIGSDQELRLLHLESHDRLGSPQPEMSRRVRAGAERRVLMPAGPVLVGLFDRTEREYRWLTGPVNVPPGGIAVIEPPAPGAGTAVLAILDRPKVALSFEEYDAEAVLIDSDGEALKPTLLVPTAERLYTVWYGVEGRNAALEIRSPTVFLPRQEIALRAGKVETHRGSLRPLPRLTVQVDIAGDLASREDGKIELLTYPERASVASRPLPSGGGTVALERVPARPLEVVLDLPPWRFAVRPDLSDGLDQEVEIRPEAVRVSGTVYRGHRPHPAVVAFRFWTGGEKYLHRVRTDDSGRYDTLLFQPSAVAIVELDEEPGPPFVQMLDETFTRDTVLDFHLPGNAFSVQVVDGETSAGVAGAQVRYVSRRGAPGEETGKEVGHRVTDGEGRAALPPIPPGELWLTASAAGYQNTEFLKLPVSQDDPGREIELILEPAGEEPGRLTLRLPSGGPAAGAEAVAVNDSDAAVWRGQADPNGVLEVPSWIEGRLMMVKSSLAGGLARPWRGGEAEWALPQPGPPLAVRVQRSWGDPAPWAPIAVEVGDRIFTGSLLQWLFGASATDARGLWQAVGLPAVPVRVVAWMPVDDSLRDPVALLGSFGVTAVPPWPGVIELEAVE